MDNKSADSNTSVSRASEPRKFTRDIIWVGVTQLFSSVIIGLGTMPVLTKHYPPVIFGTWIQIQITYGLLSPLIAMQLSLAVVRFISGEQDKAKKRQILGTMLFAITVVSGVFLVVGNIFASRLSLILFNTPDYTVFAHLTVLWIVVSAYFTFFISYLRAIGKIRLLSVFQVSVDILTLGIVILLASRGIQLEWVVTSVIGLWVLFTLLFFILMVGEVGWPFPDTTGLKSYLAFSAPQIPGGILLWLVGSSDRYFITHMLGLSQTGIYTSSDTLGNLITLFYFPIQFVLFPTLARLWEEKRFDDVKNYLEYSTRLYLTLAIPAVAGITLLSQPLLRILTTSQYLIGDSLVFLIASGTLFLGIYQINIIMIYMLKQTKLLPLIVGAAAVINILMNILLIPRIGLVGAAISNITSFLVLAFIISFWARKQVNYGIDLRYLLKVIGATVVMSAFLYFFKAHGVWRLCTAMVAGTLIYLVCLLLLRGFSQQDRRLIKNVFGILIPGVKN